MGVDQSSDRIDIHTCVYVYIYISIYIGMFVYIIYIYIYVVNSVNVYTCILWGIWWAHEMFKPTPPSSK